MHPSAIVDAPASIGEDTAIWHFSHVMSGAVIGRRCTVGQNCFVASDVRIGNGVKVQNNVSIYDGTTIEDDVFLGPSCVLTNVSNPRSEVDRRALYERTTIRRGATIGANATVVCGLSVGRYSFIGAGAVVTSDVPDYAFILGVPGRRVGWMSRHGHRLALDVDGARARCPESGLTYERIDEATVRCVDLDEEAPLPEALRKGQRRYRTFERDD